MDFLLIWDSEFLNFVGNTEQFDKQLGIYINQNYARSQYAPLVNQNLNAI